MSDQYTWQESMRQANLDKHKLDFMDADWALESPYRLDIETERKGERRQQSFSYVFDLLMVSTVVYVPDNIPHLISYRPAKCTEREAYYDWLENDYDDT